MWILHKGNRDIIVSLNAWDEVHLKSSSIIFLKGEKTRLMEFDNEQEARQAYGYLLEAIKRKDDLVHL
jgi:hypothetical protein